MYGKRYDYNRKITSVVMVFAIILCSFFCFEYNKIYDDCSFSLTGDCSFDSSSDDYDEITSSEELSLSSLHTALTRRLSGRKSTFNSVSFDAITGCVALISSLILIISFFHEVLAINYSHKFIMNYIHAKDGQK